MIMKVDDVKQSKMVVGRVLSNKMQKTIVIEVVRSLRHDKYDKVVRRKRKVMVHDENQSAKPGDLVSAVFCAPMSKNKCMILKDVLNHQ